MRLIDADALKEEIEFHPTSVSVCMTAEQARGETNFKLRCLKDINAAPTIDAIPVEWIKARWEKGWLPDSERCVCEGWLIEDWEKEQEAR